MDRLLQTFSPNGYSGWYVARTIAYFARITNVTYRFPMAEAAAKAALLSGISEPWLKLLAGSALGLIAVQRGDAVRAAEQYEALELSRNNWLGSIRNLDLP